MRGAGHVAGQVAEQQRAVKPPLTRPVIRISKLKSVIPIVIPTVIAVARVMVRLKYSLARSHLPTLVANVFPTLLLMVCVAVLRARVLQGQQVVITVQQLVARHAHGPVMARVAAQMQAAPLRILPVLSMDLVAQQQGHVLRVRQAVTITHQLAVPRVLGPVAVQVAARPQIVQKPMRPVLLQSTGRAARRTVRI